MNFKRVLVLSPHTDDGEYGAGGTIARLVKEGAEVHYIAFSAPTEELKEECTKATKLLGVKTMTAMNFPRRRLHEHRQDILQTLYELDKKLKPDLVLVPSRMDIHQDHNVVTEEASRGIFLHSTILGYELPHNIRVFNQVVGISSDNLKKKTFALSQYKSQIERYYFDSDFIHSWARFRGGQINAGYAECFEVIKAVEMLSSRKGESEDRA